MALSNPLFDLDAFSKAEAAVTVRTFGILIAQAASRSDRVRHLQRDWRMLSVAPPELKGNKEVMIQLLKLDCRVWWYIAESLEDDVDMLREQLTRWGSWPTEASPNSNNNAALIGAGHINHVRARWERLPEELRGEVPVMRRAVQVCGETLMYASPALRAQREIVVHAVKKNGMALEVRGHEGRRAVCVCVCVMCV